MCDGAKRTSSQQIGWFGRAPVSNIAKARPRILIYLNGAFRFPRTIETVDPTSENLHRVKKRQSPSLRAHQMAKSRSIIVAVGYV